MKYEYHPISNWYPRQTGDDLQSLKDNIANIGQQRPIILFEGMIADGRHRYEICLELGIEPRFETFTGTFEELDALLQALNAHTKPITKGQRIAIGLEREAYYAEQAKKKENERKSTSANWQKSDEEIHAMSKASQAVDIPERTLHRAKATRKASPELYDAIVQDEIAPSAAYEVASDPDKLETFERLTNDPVNPLPAREAVKVAKQTPNIKPANSGVILLADYNLMTDSEKHEVMQFDIANNSTFNKQKGDSIEWAQWSWNPVTGCKHECPYCYARDIANRFYAHGFQPAIIPSRLDAPYSQRVPMQAENDTSYKNVFVCSMADLFGRWVPTEWIQAVLDVCEDNPQWNFLFLTKFPIRMSEFNFPDNCWVGTTVDHQARVKNAEKAFAKVNAKVKWLSIEPMLTPLKFNDLSMFQWVVLGGSSSSNETPEWKPPFEWIANLTQDAWQVGTKVYFKTNLLERVKQFPMLGQDSELRTLPKSLAYLPDVE